MQLILFAALILPFHDGSGEVKFLGIFTSKEEAEAAIYRNDDLMGYKQVSIIYEWQLEINLYSSK